MHLWILSGTFTLPALPGLEEGDMRGRRRGGGEHGHCDTIKEGNAKIPFGTLNKSIWDEFLIVSPFLESLIRSLGSWPHCWPSNEIIIYSSTWDVFLTCFNVSLILSNIVPNSPSHSISSWFTTSHWWGVKKGRRSTWSSWLLQARDRPSSFCKT